MKAKRVLLLDLGLAPEFTASTRFIEAIVDNINAGIESEIEIDEQDEVTLRLKTMADVEIVRSRDKWTVAGALTSDCHVLHILAHSSKDKVSALPTFYSSDHKEKLDLRGVAEEASTTLNSLIAPDTVVIADGCKTGVEAWRKAFSDSVEGPICYIGTSALIGWYESTVFCSAFYSAMLRLHGAGVNNRVYGARAARKARASYKALTGKECPYRIHTLEPSAKAARMMAN